jgi:hypothetical protein
MKTKRQHLISLWNRLRRRQTIPLTPEGLAQVKAALHESRLELLRHILVIVGDLDEETMAEMKSMLGTRTPPKPERFASGRPDYIQ